MTATDSQLPESAHIGRVALTVSDLETMTDFYTSVVGLSVIEAESDHRRLGIDDTELLRLEAAPDLAERPPTAAGLFHTAFRVPTRTALGNALDRVRSSWSLEGASDHHVSEALYLTDPEGNGVEIYCDRPEETWPTTSDGRVQMETLPLDLDRIAASATEGAPQPSELTIGHVHLEATELTRMRTFYIERLGFRLRQEFGEAAIFLAAGTYHHHIGINTWQGRSEPAAGRGLAWYEVVLPGTEAVDNLRDRLSANDISVIEKQGRLEIVDPDGISIRLRSSN